jgi:hypothetical protein
MTQEESGQGVGDVLQNLRLAKKEGQESSCPEGVLSCFGFCEWGLEGLSILR